MSDKSRADYFKKRREDYKAFYVELEKNKMDCLEDILKKHSMTKKEWLIKKIDEEISMN